MSNEEIEALRNEAIFEYTDGTEDNYKRWVTSDVSYYQTIKNNYQTKLDNWEGNRRVRELEQYQMDMQLDMFEGKISGYDFEKYSDVIGCIRKYYEYVDDENNIRKSLAQIETQLLNLRAEKIYNGKLLTSVDASEKISELSYEKNMLEDQLQQALEQQSGSLIFIPTIMERRLGKDPRYDKFYKKAGDMRDDEKFISDTRNNLDEIINLIETDIIDLKNKKEYSENKKRYKEVEEEMAEIEFSLTHEADQLNKGKMFLLKQQYKELCKEKLRLRNITPIDFISEEKSNTSTIKKEEQKEHQKSNTSGVKKEEKSYTKLVAAQNEANRRLRIKDISNVLSKEKLKKNAMAIVSGICFAGMMAAVHFSGIDPNKAIATEIQALNSFDSFKEYLGTFTPAMWGTMIATSLSLSRFIKHKKNYNKANQEFCDMMDNKPEDYLGIVESQAKSR